MNVPFFRTNFVGMGRLATSATRFDIAFQAALHAHIRPVAFDVVKDAQAQLTPGHGYDTGKLHDSLTAILVDIAGAVIYRIESPEAAYWAYVEFGHMLRNGQWWEGYHFIERAVDMHKDRLWDATRESFRDACAVTRGDIGVGGAARILGLMEDSL